MVVVMEGWLLAGLWCDAVVVVVWWVVVVVWLVLKCVEYSRCVGLLWVVC